jgi:hypothetical protein
MWSHLWEDNWACYKIQMLIESKAINITIRYLKFFVAICTFSWNIGCLQRSLLLRVEFPISETSPTWFAEATCFSTLGSWAQNWSLWWVEVKISLFWDNRELDRIWVSLWSRAYFKNLFRWDYSNVECLHNKHNRRNKVLLSVQFNTLKYKILTFWLPEYISKSKIR